VGLKPAPGPTTIEAASRAKSNQGGIETNGTQVQEHALPLRQNRTKVGLKRVSPALRSAAATWQNRTKVGLKHASASALLIIAEEAKSNQGGIETKLEGLHGPDERTRQNRTKVGLKHSWTFTAGIL